MYKKNSDYLKVKLKYTKIVSLATEPEKYGGPSKIGKLYFKMQKFEKMRKKFGNLFIRKNISSENILNRK